MAEPAAPQAGADIQPQEGGQDAAPAGQEPGGGQEPRTFDLEYVQKLRNESASYRTKLSNAEKRLQEIENGQLSEMQKLQKQLEAVTTERDGLLRDARQGRISTAASKLNAKYPDAVARLVPDDADTQEAIDAALKTIRKDYPDLFRPVVPSVDGGAGANGTPQSQDMNAMIRQAAGRGNS
jgi:hypothetical protein